MFVLIITIGVIVLAAIGSGTIIITKKKPVVQRVIESIADVAKVGLEQVRLALLDDNKVDPEEIKGIFSSMLDQVKKEITDAANGE